MRFAGQNPCCSSTNSIGDRCTQPSNQESCSQHSAAARCQACNPVPASGTRATGLRAASDHSRAALPRIPQFSLMISVRNASYCSTRAPGVTNSRHAVVANATTSPSSTSSAEQAHDAANAALVTLSSGTIYCMQLAQSLAGRRGRGAVHPHHVMLACLEMGQSGDLLNGFSPSGSLMSPEVRSSLALQCMLLGLMLKASHVGCLKCSAGVPVLCQAHPASRRCHCYTCSAAVRMSPLLLRHA
jgi:hypothetical protein